MPEFTVEIDTDGGLVVAEEDLLMVDELLRGNEFILSPSVSLQAGAGIIGATFHVEAGNARDAADIAINVFSEAIQSSLEPEASIVGTVNVEEAKVDRLLVERVHERSAVPA